jgi:hypothetical protein
MVVAPDFALVGRADSAAGRRLVRQPTRRYLSFDSQAYARLELLSTDSNRATLREALPDGR